MHILVLPLKCTILQLLHMIARHLGHVYDGYQYMTELGYTDVAKVCLTHSFSIKTIDAYIGKSDIMPEELAHLLEILHGVDYDDYDLGFEKKATVQSTTSVIRKIEEPRIRRFRINWKVTIFLSLLVSFILWFVVGILMGRGYLPRVDIGYTWFNSHIVSIF